MRWLAIGVQVVFLSINLLTIGLAIRGKRRPDVGNIVAAGIIGVVLVLTVLVTE